MNKRIFEVVSDGKKWEAVLLSRAANGHVSVALGIVPLKLGHGAVNREDAKVFLILRTF